MDEKEFKEKVINFYKNNNNKITIRDFKSKNGLPSISGIKKKFGISSIIDIKKFCGIPITKKDKKLSNRHKYTYKEIYNIFKKQGCELLSKEIPDGVSSKVEYRCECGNISTVKISDFISKNIRCKKCGIKKNTLNRRKPYEDIKHDYIKNGCELLSDYSEYSNNSSVLKFRCSCGNVDEKTYSAFRLIPRCKKCHKSIRLENHYAWKGGISPLNEYLRKHIYCWKIDSAKKYDFKSDISGKPFEVIHHVNKNFSDIVIEVLDILKLEPKQIKDYTSKELEDITNLCIELHYSYGFGVCLTEEEHKLFHSIYGTENNTKEQYEEFKKQYYN